MHKRIDIGLKTIAYFVVAYYFCMLMALASELIKSKTTDTLANIFMIAGGVFSLVLSIGCIKAETLLSKFSFIVLSIPATIIVTKQLEGNVKTEIVVRMKKELEQKHRQTFPDTVNISTIPAIEKEHDKWIETLVCDDYWLKARFSRKIYTRILKDYSAQYIASIPHSTAIQTAAAFPVEFDEVQLTQIMREQKPGMDTIQLNALLKSLGIDRHATIHRWFVDGNSLETGPVRDFFANMLINTTSNPATFGRFIKLERNDTTRIITDIYYE